MREGEIDVRRRRCCCRLVKSSFGSFLASTGWTCMNPKINQKPPTSDCKGWTRLSRGDCLPLVPAFPLPSQAELKRSAFRPCLRPLLNTTSSHTFPSACRFDFLLHNVFTNCSHGHVFPPKFLYGLKTTFIPSATPFLFNYLGQTRNTGSLHIECCQDTNRKGML